MISSKMRIFRHQRRIFPKILHAKIFEVISKEGKIWKSRIANLKIANSKEGKSGKSRIAIWYRRYLYLRKENLENLACKGFAICYLHIEEGKNLVSAFKGEKNSTSETWDVKRDVRRRTRKRKQLFGELRTVVGETQHGTWSTARKRKLALLTFLCLDKLDKSTLLRLVHSVLDWVCLPVRSDHRERGK